MNRYYRWMTALVLSAPFVWEVWRVTNSIFDAWFIAQLHKAWRVPYRGASRRLD